MQKMQKSQIRGNLFGFKFLPYQREDGAFVHLQLLTEDDGCWYETTLDSFDAFWLDDLISLCKKTKKYLNNNAEKRKSGGWKYN